MRVAFIGDTSHYIDGRGRLCALGPVVMQLDRLGTLFDDVVICAPLHGGEPPIEFVPYGLKNVSFVPLEPGGGARLTEKVCLIERSLNWAINIRKVSGFSDVLHFRCPSNVGAVGLVATWHLRRHRYAMYAGSWEASSLEPWSYRAQRWLLRRRSFGGFVSVYGAARSDPHHVFDFFSPSFDDRAWAREIPHVEARLGRLGTVPTVTPIRLVSVGSLVPNKGHDLVVAALADLESMGVSATLEVVGSGPEYAALERKAEALGVRDRLALLGPQDRQGVTEALRRADFACLMSETEGYPKVVLEAMMAGAVPIVSPFPMARSMTGEGARGVTLEARTSNALARAVAELSSAPQLVAPMVREGRAYTHERTLEAFTDFLSRRFQGSWGHSLCRSSPSVIHVIDRLDRGGQERLIVDLANAMANAGARVAVCETRSSGDLAEELAHGVDHLVLGRSRTWDMRAVARFAAWAKQWRPDVVHSHGSMTMRFVALSRIVARTGVHLFHEHISAGEVGGIPVSDRLAMRLGGDGVLAVDDRMAAAWKRASNWSRTETIPNAIDLTRFDGEGSDLHDEFGVPPETMIAVCTANFRHPKDHHTLVRALAQTAADVCVLLVGDEHIDPIYTSTLRDLIRLEGVGDRVRECGLRSDVPRLLASADFGVLTSLHESGPLAIAEYAAAGLPFVATRTGGVSKAIAGAKGGLLALPGSIHAVAEALDEMSSMSAAARRAMGCRGRAFVETHYGLPRLVEDLFRIYSDAISDEMGVVWRRSALVGGSPPLTRMTSE